MRLIDADALIEKLRIMPIPEKAGSANTWLDNCAAGVNAAIREVASFPAADVAPAVRWIPVSEQLPETADEFVLVCVSGKPTKFITLHGALELACYSPHCGWILENWPDWENANVTHWAPLPKPPEVVPGG